MDPAIYSSESSDALSPDTALPDSEPPDAFSPEPPTPARIVFEYAAAEIKRREILVERCLSMALYWRQRAEFAYERLQTAITVAEDAARACGKTGNQP